MIVCLFVCLGDDSILRLLVLIVVQLYGRGKTSSNMWAALSLYPYLIFFLHFETKSH